MKVTYVAAYPNYGRITLEDDAGNAEIKLSEDECQRFILLAYEIVTARREVLIDKLRACEPPLLAAPDAIDVEFVELD